MRHPATHRRRLLGASLGLVAAPVLAAAPADAFEGDPFRSFQWPELKKEFLGARARVRSPVRKVLKLQPLAAQVAVSFRFKPQQALPVRAMVETACGLWHAACGRHLGRFGRRRRHLQGMGPVTRESFLSCAGEIRQ